MLFGFCAMDDTNAKKLWKKVNFCMLQFNVENESLKKKWKFHFSQGE